MSKKFVKLFAGVAVVGAAAAGAYYWFHKKSDSDFEDEFNEDFEAEEFELDEDLKDVTNRGYTPLNAAGTTSEEADPTTDHATEPVHPEESPNETTVTEESPKVESAE